MVIVEFVGLKYGEKGFNWDNTINIIKSVGSFGLFAYSIGIFIYAFIP